MRFFSFLLLLFCQSAFGNILHVPADYPSIQAAYDATSHMDTVLVERGIYQENILAPEHSTWLMSNYAFTQDSADIVETILDGNLAGTVLTLQAAGEYASTVDGFSLTRGGESEIYIGSTIYYRAHANLILRNSVLRDNELGSFGVIFNGFGEPEFVPQSNVVLDNVAFHDNEHTSSLSVRLTAAKISLNRIRILRHESGLDNGLSAYARDSLVANDIMVRGVEGAKLSLTSDRKICVENIQATGCSNFYSRLGGGVAILNNILFDSLDFGYSDYLIFGADSQFVADSITVSNCYRPDYHILGGIASFTSGVSLHRSSVSNLHILNNTVGPRPEDVDSVIDHVQPRIVYASSVNLHDCVFRGNTAHVWDDGIHDSTAPGAILTWKYRPLDTETDTSRLQYCLFEDNFVDDHNDHEATTPEFHPENRGKTLLAESVGSSQNRNVEIDHLVFRNNRQPNHVPEDGDIMSHEVSNDFRLMDRSHTGLISVHDILLEDIDDGGMIVSIYHQPDPPVLEMYNIILRRVNRQGLWVGGVVLEDSFLSNILIDEVVAQDAGPISATLQHAFLCSVDSLAIDNMSIINCDVPVLLATSTDLESCLFQDNSYDVLQNPFLYTEGSFNNCYADFELEGETNIYGLDPQFDPVLGAPYLLPTSPLIDSGNPDMIFNDIEDPEAPGTALWPSLGGLRNDIGFTGGPRAALPDTQWVDLPKLDPEILLAKSFQLGNPYPNPFNPVTQIPFALMRPAEVELTIYDLLGRKMTTLVEGAYPVGTHVARFHGGGLASGMYLSVLLVDGEQVDVKKMLLVK
jgi:hypothetical protein